MFKNKYTPASKKFDWVYIFFTGLWTFGAFIDGWAHNNIISSIESFFTPWHVVFYAGIILTGILLVVYLYINYRNGYPWKYALPKEYFFGLVGVIITIIGGIGDLGWHAIFGIEDGTEALLSPTHLLLAIGGAMAVAAPLHAVWYRHKSELIHSLPTIISAAYFFSIITFMLQFLYPFNLPWMAESLVVANPVQLEYSIMFGIANILVYTVVVVGIILSTVKHWIFPFGSFTAILGVNTLLMVSMSGYHFEFVVSSIIAGLIIDALYRYFIKENQHRMPHIHLFAFLVPLVIFSAYMAAIFITDNIIWTVHMWTGAIFIAGIVGYLMSYLVIPRSD